MALAVMDTGHMASVPLPTSLEIMQDLNNIQSDSETGPFLVLKVKY